MESLTWNVRILSGSMHAVAGTVERYEALFKAVLSACGDFANDRTLRSGAGWVIYVAVPRTWRRRRLLRQARIDLRLARSPHRPQAATIRRKPREQHLNCINRAASVIDSDMRLLIVEDEARIAELVKAGLARAGFAVDVVRQCSDARAALSVTSYDAAVVDLGLPDGDGLDLLRELRTGGNQTPVLVLTARDAVEDRVRGLDTGADDYLVKPFAMAELVARAKALLRRPGGALGAILKAGNISFDTIERDVMIGGSSLVLPRRESAILEHLMRRLGRVVPKSVLEEKLYGIDDEHGSNTIPVHVHHLRRKLSDCRANADHTVRGVGYLLTEISE
jgi:DNA-binding response OmpR family regulator